MLSSARLHKDVVSQNAFFVKNVMLVAGPSGMEPARHTSRRTLRGQITGNPTLAIRNRIKRRREQRATRTNVRSKQRKIPDKSFF